MGLRKSFSGHDPCPGALIHNNHNTFWKHAASAKMATTASAGSVTGTASAVRASAVAAGQLTYKVIKKRKEKGLDSEGRPPRNTKSQVSNSEAKEVATESQISGKEREELSDGIAVVMRRLAEDHYVKMGHRDVSGISKTKLEQTKVCEVTSCKCADFDPYQQIYRNRWWKTLQFWPYRQSTYHAPD